MIVPHILLALCFSADLTGINCSESYDPCDPNPCANGGTCQKSYDGHYFQCNCPAGYGGLTCEGIKCYYVIAVHTQLKLTNDY